MGRTLPKRHLGKRQLSLMAREEDGAAFPRESSLTMPCLSAVL